MSTNTYMPPPACENCGRDKSPTYICDNCINKLNAATRAITAERDEWKRRCEELERRLDGLERFIAIAEGRDNG